MTARLAFRLARPAARADRGRFLLIAGATASAGALLLAAAHIARLQLDRSWIGQDDGLAAYVTQDGLRPGVVIATLLLVVPVLALAVQALRVGSVARDRRMASLRLAGATPGDVRAIAAAEAGVAAAAGGLLAGPAYLILWLLVGVLPPESARMLDTPDAYDALAWAALVPLALLAGGLSGAAIYGRAVVEPLGVRRRARPPEPGRVSFAVLVAGLVLVVIGVVAARVAIGSDGAVLGLLLAMMLGLLLAAFAGGSRLVLGSARLLARRPGAERLLASRRLRADPRSAGRVAGVLVICGVALGLDAVLVAEQVGSDGFGDDATFYLTGYAMAALAVLVSAGVAMLTMLVGAADGLLDARRPLAALAVHGVDERLLTRVLARQLSATAVPAVVAGALIGGPAIALLGIGPGAALLVGGATALAAGLVLAVTARLAARRAPPAGPRRDRPGEPARGLVDDDPDADVVDAALGVDAELRQRLRRRHRPEPADADALRALEGAALLVLELGAQILPCRALADALLGVQPR
jgi:hypothetical protein